MAAVDHWISVALIFVLQLLINPELRKRSVYWVAFLMTGFLTATYMLYDDYSDVLTFVINLGLIYFVKNKRYFVITALIANLAYILFSFFSNYVTEQLFAVAHLSIGLAGGWAFEFFGELIVAGSMLLVAWSFRKLHRRYLEQFSDSMVLNVIASALVVVAIFYFVLSAAADNYSIGKGFLGILMFTLVAVLVVNALTFVYLFYTYTMRANANRQALERKQYDIYVGNLENSYQNLRKFRHDYLNILLSLNEYVQDSHDQELIQYFDDVLQRSQVNLNRDFGHFDNLERIKDKSLKSIIQSKFAEAQQQGIRVHLEAATEIDRLAIDPMVISRVVGILLDNAIEATSKQKAGTIGVAIINYSQMLELVIDNSLTAPIPRVADLLVAGRTSKGAGHGQGLATVKELLDQLPNVTYEVAANQHFQFIISIMKGTA